MAKRKTQPAQQRGGELQFDGFDRQLYCWIRHRRMFLAVHKSLYYDYDDPILDDFKYDRVEYQLTVVEERHPDISAAVTAEGYLSPSSYVGSLRLPSVMERAKEVHQHWIADGRPELPFAPRDKNESDNLLYEDALKRISKYPI